MSNAKQALLGLKGFNLFRNTKAEVEFSLNKETKAKASHSYYDKEKGLDVRALYLKNDSSPEKSYTRLSVSLTVDGRKEFFNGALFQVAEKKSDKSPDFTGVLNLDSSKDGPKLRLAGWKKVSDKAGSYLSCSIQEYQKTEK
jgi:uncharacterized protein (DUF736 family)